MTAIKTAISIDRSLYDELETLAGEMGVSRSQLFSLAAREFVERRRNRRLREAINEAHEDVGPEGDYLMAKMKPKHRRLVQGKW